MDMPKNYPIRLADLLLNVVKAIDARHLLPAKQAHHRDVPKDAGTSRSRRGAKDSQKMRTAVGCVDTQKMRYIGVNIFTHFMAGLHMPCACAVA